MLLFFVHSDRSGETVTAMLNTGTNVNVSDNKNKSTPLHLAVNQGNDAGVRSLLASRHCDVNCQVKIVFANKKLSAGETPLPPPRPPLPLGILSEGVPPGSPNPDPISDQKMWHFPHPF